MEAYVVDKVIKYFDKNKGCIVRKEYYKSSSGKVFSKIYDCYQPPPKEKSKNKVLQKNKRRYNNQK